MSLSFDFHVFLSVFGVIFLAELPDKTALAALVLATKHKPLPVFLGAAAAQMVQCLIAIAAGGLLSLLPARPVHIGAGVLFLVFAVMMWRRDDEDEEVARKEAEERPPTFLRVFAQVFGVIFAAEWGDLTQLGTAALAARYAQPVTVFLGATLALFSVAGIAVFLGHRAGKLLNPKVTKRVAAVVFAALGLLLIAGVF